MTTHRKERQVEQAAYEQIVLHYEVRLIRYATRVTGSGDAAQDVVQDTFIRLFRHWTGDLDPSPALSGWLYRVTHNRAVDEVRRRSRRTDIETRHAAEQPESIPPPVAADATLTQRAEIALRVLDSREQQLVILKVYEGKSYKEISEITGLTAGNVGYILHHAMKKMAKTLKTGESQ